MVRSMDDAVHRAWRVMWIHDGQHTSLDAQVIGARRHQRRADATRSDRYTELRSMVQGKCHATHTET